MHDGSYSTYIMASRSHTMCIGITRDLHKRVFQHKWKEDDGFAPATIVIAWYGSKGTMRSPKRLPARSK
jgi:predicted GIY-YIG superfamily endonuclease